MKNGSESSTEVESEVTDYFYWHALQCAEVLATTLQFDTATPKAVCLRQGWKELQSRIRCDSKKGEGRSRHSGCPTLRA
jgi:hypothetical protein